MQAIEDHYATLGVAPKSEAVEIRAAYLALMRRFHPDRNDSPEAIERAHAIIAAFAVLGNVEKRLHYDWGRRRAAEAAAQPPKTLPRAWIAAALGLLLLVPLSLIWFPVTVSEPPVAPPASTVVANDPIQIPNEEAVAEPLIAEMPVATPGQTAIIEPIPLEPAAAAEPVPKVGEVPLVRAPPPKVLSPRERRQARNAVKPQPQPASAKAHCRFATPGAAAAVCNNDDLAALDRSVVAFYNQSLQFAAVAKQGTLLDSRTGFLLRREQCRSDACLRSIHLDHLRELSAIVEERDPDPLR